MDKKTALHILSAPIVQLRRAKPDEQAKFSDKNNDWAYYFELASKQSFIAYLDRKELVYTFYPVNNLLQGLHQIKWQKEPENWSMNYITACQTDNETDKTVYQEILAPKPIPAPYLTKMSIQHYAYHPMLDKAHWLRQALLDCENAKMNLLIAHESHDALLVSGEKKQDLTKNLIQQKLKERRKNG
jgi:hypothetical protein